MKTVIKSLIVGAAMVGIAGVANAIPTIYVSSTGTAGSYSAVASSSSGSLTYSNNVGSWDIVVATGLTMPALGTATSPTMDLDITGKTTSSTGGSVWIAFAANGFSDPSGLIQAILSGHVVSGAAETVTFSVFDDTLNTQPTTTIPTGFTIATLGPLSTPILTTATAALLAGVPATLGVLMEISTTGSSSTSMDGSFAPVPDGGVTALLLGAALFTLALLKRKVLA